MGSRCNVQITETSSNRRDASPASRGDGESLITIAPTSENLALFSPGDTSVSAKTRVFTDRKGFVTEADIVLNPYAMFSTDGSYASYDLEGVLTHEIGHLLGLRHSQIMGSVMHGNVDVNSGIGPGFAPRKALSAEDISSIRSLYGAPAGVELCCGRVRGKLLVGNGSISGSMILLEDKNGEIAAGSRVEDGGEFSFAGLSDGTYAVLLAREGVGSLAEDLGTLTVETGVISRFEAKPVASLIPFELAYVGADGLLSTSGVKLMPGSSSLVTIGGRGLIRPSLRSIHRRRSSASMPPRLPISHILMTFRQSDSRFTSIRRLPRAHIRSSCRCLRENLGCCPGRSRYLDSY